MDHVAQWVGAEWLKTAAVKVCRNYMYVTGCAILSVEDYEQQGLLSLARIPADTPPSVLYTIVYRRMIDYAREMSFSTRRKLTFCYDMPSIDDYVSNNPWNRNLKLKDFIAAPETNTTYNELEVSMLIESTKTLTEQERMCMRLYYVAGFKMVEVAFRCQVCSSRVSQLCASGVRKLRDRCNARPTSNFHVALRKTTKKPSAVSLDTSCLPQTAQLMIGLVN